MFRRYDKKIRDILDSNDQHLDWNKILLDHREMISNIQHERLIHLLVMIFVGLAFCIFCVAVILTGNRLLGILDLILMFLFLGYIFHYRYLENTTQGWYTLTEIIKKKM